MCEYKLEEVAYKIVTRNSEEDPFLKYAINIELNKLRNSTCQASV